MLRGNGNGVSQRARRGGARGATVSMSLVVALLVAACGAGGGPHGAAQPAARVAAAGASSDQGTADEAFAHLQDPRRTVAYALRHLAPVRLVIPKMGLDAPILALGPAADGSMQAPVAGGPSNPIYGDVYWWDAGSMPGQVGNAVLAGHINRPDGSPASFGNLNVLNPGNQLRLVTAGGNILAFVVTAKDAPLVYTRGDDDPTIESIFGPSLTPNLNLLTCWGKWNGTTYDRRLTIRATLVGPSPFPLEPGVWQISSGK
jgi:hypothetical protein